MNSERPIAVGVVYPADAPAEGLPSFARQVERAGFEELWLIEDCFLSGGLTMASTALAVTSRLRVGVGLIPASIRNPVLVAMEIATLANLYPERFVPAFGHGVAAWMRQIAALPEKRLAALEEVVVAVRALLAGATVTTAGTHVRLDGVALANPPSSPPPVLVGTTGPKGLALAGRGADGILLPEGCGPAFVAWALEQAEAAAPEDREVDCAVYAWLRIEDDADAARAALGPAIVKWLGTGLFPAVYRRAGLRSPPDPGFDPSGLAESLAVAGDPAACAAAIGGFAAAGATRLALVPVGPDPVGQVARLGAEVLPGLASVTAA